MSQSKIAAVVLAAGMGTRMKSDMPKVLHRLAGKPMVRHVIDSLEPLSPDRVVVVVGPDQEAVSKAVAPHPIAVQTERLGTAHALLAAREHLEGFDGDVLVLFGDSPMVRTETLERMLAARHGTDDPAVVVSAFRAADPGVYGRLITDADGRLEAIVEARDATPEQLDIDLCSGGFMAFDGRVLLSLLDRIDNNNTKGEYYLTHIVEKARLDNRICTVVEAPEAEFLGVNARTELAAAEALLQVTLRHHAMTEGVTLTAPDTVFFCADTKLGRDVVIGPHVVFGPGVTVGDNVEILSFCHIEEATIADGARVGPYARLRPGADIGKDAHIGNFVEVKNAVIEDGAKANHLSYIGDARVGAGSNIGAGTITCNYDGFFKHHTDIGANVFIGSNTALVAPVRIADGALIGAGSVLSTDVPADALALTRGPLKQVDGWAARFRKTMTAAKAKAKAEGKED